MDCEIGRLVRWTFAASCIVLALDVKRSLASLNHSASGNAPAALRLDSVFSTALRFVQKLAQHCSSHPGQHVHITIIAQGSTTVDLRIVCHHTLLRADNVDQLIAKISAEFDGLRSQLINGSWCCHETHQPEHPRSNLQHLLVNCLRLLDLLPRYGCPGITLITDGVVTMHNELSLLDMAGENTPSVELCSFSAGCPDRAPSAKIDPTFIVDLLTASRTDYCLDLIRQIQAWCQCRRGGCLGWWVPGRRRIWAWGSSLGARVSDTSGSGRLWVRVALRE